MDVFSGILLILFLIACGVFWLWSLIDCLKSEWKNPNDKIVWLLVILLLNLFGSLLYLLIAGSKKVKHNQPQPTTPPSEPSSTSNSNS